MKNLRARDIMIKEVECIDEEEIVALAKLRMSRQGIGGLPVTKRNKLSGIITHRDIILSGDEVQKLKVRDIMSRNLVTVEEKTPLKDIIDIMARTGYQRLPVVKNEKISGIVTQSCVINALARYLQ